MTAMLRLLVTVLFGFQLVVAIPTADLTANPSSLRMSRVECVDSDEWKAPNFVKEDCYVAVQDLYRWDVRFRPDLIVTFFSSSHSRPAVLSVQTPKRYVDSSCTLALVNLNLFTPHSLPGHIPHGSLPVDQATFREVYQAARALEEQCVGPSGRPGKVGWTVVGTRMSLGVFLWATDSSMNHEIRNSILGLGFADNETLGVGVDS